MLYRWKVRFLKSRRGDLIWRGMRAWRRSLGGQIDVGAYSRLPGYVRDYARGHSFADIGCMWGVNGEYAFIAEEAGATAVKGVDVFGPTPEFEERKRTSGSSIEFILGDVTQPETIARVGPVEVVLCAGVLYHHPSPFDVLTALRRMCTEDTHPSHLDDPGGPGAAERRRVLPHAEAPAKAALGAFGARPAGRPFPTASSPKPVTETGSGG